VTKSAALARVTTVERMAEGICDLILRGEVEPGTALRESQLQSTIGVSRNTIREALRLLERDGLVTYHPYRGVAVTELDREDVVDLFRARMTLELSAVKAAASLTSEQLEAMTSARGDREAAVAKADWHTAFEADIRFHAALVAVLGSKTLDRFFVGLLRKIRLGFYMRGGLSTEGRERDTEQHRRIEEALADADVERARAAVTEHLEDAEGLLLELIAGADA
jgi:DNA-binding GntR family transcriptional regulator